MMSNDLYGKRVVIVDDLLTSGSSLMEYAHNLERAGAKVEGAVFQFHISCFFIFGQIARDKNTVFPVKKQTFSHSFNLLPQTERSLTSDDI